MKHSFLINGLYGASAHVSPPDVFEGLSGKEAGLKTEEAPHTVWDILFHMTWWQDLLLQKLQNGSPAYPAHNSETFPVSSVPGSEKEWHDTLQRFKDGLREMEAETEKNLEDTGFDDGTATRGDFIIDIITHNSYHAAQAAQIRRMTGTWPPPSGGQTW
ncbi:DinB family protein [Salibacterium aidingense]|uniref:DinB family protein n=1 Tax=Salibacterium aidingense TaxID=384933 RepID=UPI003BE9E3B3